MASIHSTNTNIFNAFTYPTLDPINNEPTYESLKLLREQLGKNAARIPTTYGGCLYGHLGLVTKPNVYFTLAGVHFVVPQDPGPYDIHIPLRAAAGERARLEKEHENVNKNMTCVCRLAMSSKTKSLKQSRAHIFGNCAIADLGISTPHLLTCLITYSIATAT